MFNKKLGIIFGLSLCCLVGCTSTKTTEVSSVADKIETQVTTEAPTEVREEINTEVEVSIEDTNNTVLEKAESDTIEASIIEDTATEVNGELIENEDGSYKVVVDSEAIADGDSTLEVYLDNESNIAEVTDDAELIEEVANEVISSIGTITAIEDNMILVSVDNANETYAQISEDTVCDSGLVVGDRVEVKHSMIEMRSLPGIWPQVYEVTKLAE